MQNVKAERPTSMILKYSSRATNEHSQLVAAPLSLQAKTHFLCGNLNPKIIIFD